MKRACKLVLLEVIVDGRVSATRPPDGDRDRERSNAGKEPESGTVASVSARVRLEGACWPLAGGATVTETIGTDESAFSTCECGCNRVPENKLRSPEDIEGIMRLATERCAPAAA